MRATARQGRDEGGEHHTGRNVITILCDTLRRNHCGPSHRDRVTRASLLADPTANLQCAERDGGLTIQAPTQVPDTASTVIQLELADRETE